MRLRLAALASALTLLFTGPALALEPLNHDHDLEYWEDNSRDADVLVRAYGRNSHLQKLLDLGLYQQVFDDNPEGVEYFLAAGAHINGLKELPLDPITFATWRHETRTVATLLAHGARPVDDATDPDMLVRKTVETVTGVQELAQREFKAAEAEHRRRFAGR
jgi:hypothetical protein